MTIRVLFQPGIPIAALRFSGSKKVSAPNPTLTIKMGKFLHRFPTANDKTTTLYGIGLGARLIVSLLLGLKSAYVIIGLFSILSGLGIPIAILVSALMHLGGRSIREKLENQYLKYALAQLPDLETLRSGLPDSVDIFASTLPDELSNNGMYLNQLFQKLKSSGVSSIRQAQDQLEDAGVSIFFVRDQPVSSVGQHNFTPWQKSDPRERYALLIAGDDCRFASPFDSYGKILQQQYHLPPDHIKILENPTSPLTLESGIQWLRSHAGPDAEALILYSGHGEKNFLAINDTNHPTKKDTRSWFNELKAYRNVTMVLDSCYSGSFLQSDP